MKRAVLLLALLLAACADIESAYDTYCSVPHEGCRDAGAPDAG